jgi:hypothetical protein
MKHHGIFREYHRLFTVHPTTSDVAGQARLAELMMSFTRSRAIGSAMLQIDRQLISPTLRRHPNLLATAEEMNRHADTGSELSASAWSAARLQGES